MKDLGEHFVNKLRESGYHVACPVLKLAAAALVFLELIKTNRDFNFAVFPNLLIIRGRPRGSFACGSRHCNFSCSKLRRPACVVIKSQFPYER